MSKIIAVSNENGGVGKTTTTLNLGARLAALGKRVLVADADPQANLTMSVGVDAPDELEITITHLMKAVALEQDGVKELAEGCIVPATERILKNRVSFWTAIQNVFTFAYRTLIKSIRNPETFMDVTIMPIMFTLVFTFLFGGSVSGSIAGYLPIIIPGILIQTFVTSCSAVGVQMREDMDKSITNRFKSMPIARIAPLAGALIADIVRFLIAGIVIFTMGAIMGYRPEAGILAVVASILFMTLIAWCLSWLFSFVALSVRSTTAASTTGMLIMFPLCFLSNAFVPSEALPSALRFFAEHINPVSKAVSAVRQILSSGTVGTDFWLALISVLVLLVVFIPLTLKVYMRKG